LLDHVVRFNPGARLSASRFSAGDGRSGFNPRPTGGVMNSEAHQKVHSEHLQRTAFLLRKAVLSATSPGKHREHQAPIRLA